MTEPHIRLKVNLLYDERNQDCDVERVERRIRDYVNTGNGSRGPVEDVRIAVGHRAGAVFLHLSPQNWRVDRFERLADDAVTALQRSEYADNVRQEKEALAKVVS